MNFSRSSFMKERHRFAQAQRDFFKTNFKEQSVPKYSDFLKNDSPLTDNIISYDVSYQVSYVSDKNSFTIEPQTFKVLGIKGKELDIQNSTMNMILDSKGVITESGFEKGTSKAIKENAKINVYPRGLEKSESKPTRDDIDRVISNGVVINKIDSVVKMKNKKGSTGDLKLDVRHF